MEWDVEYTDEFGEWWDTLSEAVHIQIAAKVALLEAKGPDLPFPHSSGINSSKHSHMHELRIQHEGGPYRIFYAFNPKRSAILLIGGKKTGNEDWYQEYVPIADRLYDIHLKELQDEENDEAERKYR